MYNFISKIPLLLIKVAKLQEKILFKFLINSSLSMDHPHH